jgi:hypothetical protein
MQTNNSSDYRIERDGQSLLVITPNKTTRVNAVGGTNNLMPTPARDAIRKAGKNPKDYFWFNGLPIRNSHRMIVETLVAKAATERGPLTPVNVINMVSDASRSGDINKFNTR